MADLRTYIRDRIAIEDRGHATPCWIWQRSLDAYGYAQCCLPGGRVRKVHRLSYEVFVGPFPLGLVTDHLCRNRDCVNPEHLEPVTNTENVRRGKAAVKWTHCKKGHPFNQENSTPGSRSCRRCKREWYLANRAEISARAKRKRVASRLFSAGTEAAPTGDPFAQDTFAHHVDGAY